MRTLGRAGVLGFALSLGLTVAPLPAAPAAPAPAPAGCPTLDRTLPWHGENRASLQALLDAHCGRKPGRRPVAAFDWDHTVIRNDVGDATVFWLLRNDKVLQPPGRDWRATSAYLTDAAATALRTACGAAEPGTPLVTSGPDTRCADEVLSVYAQAKTTSGATAFAGADLRRAEPGYAWAAQLLAGRTDAEVAAFAAAARAENLAAPVGATQRVGSRQVTGWVRYYDQQRDLIGALRRTGFDVWVVSASPEPVVRVWAAGVGIPADRVIGIRNVHKGHRITYAFEGCGGVPDGPTAPITYIDGKRCWLNKVVFHVPDRRAFERQPAARRPVFAAGDSTTDLTFVADATALRLVVNRNKAELMCHAYDNSDGRWLVNPMFLQPLPRRATPYPCSTTAHTAADGTPGPVRRADGTVIPDQLDTAF
ncbi:hypothetical protein SUDANB95_02534 [Actinosynnema sp. ALI-1.44]